MPNYPGAANAVVPVNSTISPVLVTPGESVYLFGKLPAPPNSEPNPNDSNVVGETPIAGQASIAAAITPGPGTHPPSIGVQFLGTGAAGAASFVIQEADTDADGLYITPSATTYTVATFATVGSNSVARADLSPTGGRFTRVKCVANPNAIPWTVKLTNQ